MIPIFSLFCVTEIFLFSPHKISVPGDTIFSLNTRTQKQRIFHVLYALLALLSCVWVDLGFRSPPSRPALRKIISPVSVAFTRLLWQCRRGRYFTVDEAYKKYGTLVRIQPNHISIADPDAIPIIYGHRNGFWKRFGRVLIGEIGSVNLNMVSVMMLSYSFEEVFSTTRDRTEHMKKEKNGVAHIQC